VGGIFSGPGFCHCSDESLSGLVFKVPSSQGYLAHKKQSPRRTLTVALCLGTYDDPREVGVPDERGNPAEGMPAGGREADASQEAVGSNITVEGFISGPREKTPRSSGRRAPRWAH